MEREKRLRKIIKILSESKNSISGSTLAKALGVTRQVIVQDVAILKSRNLDIVSTARGYILNDKMPKFRRLIAVKHTKEMIRKELMCIVENGGEVLDVRIEHPLYGEIRGNLNIKTADDVEVFISAMESSNAVPLLTLSNGVHLHTIGANSKETLDKIENALKNIGILI